MIPLILSSPLLLFSPSCFPHLLQLFFHLDLLRCYCLLFLLDLRDLLDLDLPLVLLLLFPLELFLL